MKLNFILQSQLTKKDLQKIIDLKKSHWNYTDEEHINWINENIIKDDIHVLMTNGENIVGYLNLIKTEVILNNQKQSFLGIGNVCASEKGIGYGKALLFGVQKYLTENNYRGILFCKDFLVAYYKKIGWKLVSKSFVISEKYKSINIMFYNVDGQFDRVEYNGRNF